MPKFADGNIFDRLDDLEAPPIMRIYSRMIPKKYKRRCHYAYPKYLVPVSARYSELIADFLHRPLEEKICIIGETLYLALTKQQSEVTQTEKSEAGKEKA